MPWQIPKYDLLAILKISHLSNQSVEELSNTLASAPMKQDIEDMTDSISSNISSISYDELSHIMSTLETLYNIREATGVELSVFIDDIIEGIEYSDYEDIDFQEIEYDSLKRKLEILLSIRILKLISKSRMIQRDGERLYCESKILSDIRPIFDDDPSVMPSLAVITHTLKITYHLGRERKDFHVILNSEELEMLHEVIIRAKIKEKTLQELMKHAKLENFDC